MGKKNKVNVGGEKVNLKKLKKGLKKTEKNITKATAALAPGGGGGGNGAARGEVLDQQTKPTRRGGRGKGGGGGEGGGGGVNGTVKSTINELLNAERPELDGKYDSESDRILAAIEASRGQIAELDPETLAGLEEQRAAEEALQERGFAQQRDRLLTRLFGQGRTEGQLAGSLGGQLIGDQQLVLQQIGAADAANRTNLRMGLTDMNLRNLGLQSQTNSDARSGALADIGLTVQDRGQRLGAASSIQNTNTQAAAQVSAARIGAAAQVQSAQIGAAAQRASAMASLEASKYATTAGLLSDQARLRQQGSQFGQDLSYRHAALQQNTQLGYAGLQNNLDVANIQGANQLAAIEANKPSTFDKALGVLGAGLSVFSDKRLKEGITPIPDAVEKVKQLDGAMWKWLGTPSAVGGGVIAQDVQKVLPGAVSEASDGHLMVDYQAIIGLLVQAVKELADGKS